MPIGLKRLHMDVDNRICAGTAAAMEHQYIKHKSGRLLLEGLVTPSNTKLSRCHNVVGPDLLGKMFRQFQLLEQF